MSAPYPAWEGAPSYQTACMLADKLKRGISDMPDEDAFVASFLSTTLEDAHPIYCPTAQLNAIEDDIFPNLASAIDYAKQARMPFGVVYLDFSPRVGEAPIVLDLAEGSDDAEEGSAVELCGVVIGENPDSELTAMVPIAKHMEKRQFLAVGLSYILWNAPNPTDASQHFDSLPVEWWEQPINPIWVNGPTVQNVLEDDGPPCGGGFFGSTHGEAITTESMAAVPHDRNSIYAIRNAAVSALVTRMALKVLFLLDSTNIELAPVELSRQARRRAERKGIGIASTIQIKRSKKHEREQAADGAAGFSHQFEVRGNFAHYGPDTYLFQHSDPELIRLCPRCGSCRRIWRPAHIKGPSDKPLHVKVRQVSTLPVRSESRSAGQP